MEDSSYVVLGRVLYPVSASRNHRKAHEALYVKYRSETRSEYRISYSFTGFWCLVICHWLHSRMVCECNARRKAALIAATITLRQWEERWIMKWPIGFHADIRKEKDPVKNSFYWEKTIVASPDITEALNRKRDAFRNVEWKRVGKIGTCISATLITGIVAGRAFSLNRK